MRRQCVSVGVDGFLTGEVRTTAVPPASFPMTATGGNTTTAPAPPPAAAAAKSPAAAAAAPDSKPIVYPVARYAGPSSCSGKPGASGAARSREAATSRECEPPLSTSFTKAEIRVPGGATDAGSAGSSHTARPPETIRAGVVRSVCDAAPH
jgi:hypothetical protein